MSDPIMHQEDGYVVLEADQPEQFLSPAELQAKLENLLASGDVEIPRELTKFKTIKQKAEHLRNNYYELDIGENKFLQWYVVRLEK